MPDKIILQTMAGAIEEFVPAIRTSKRVAGYTNVQVAELTGVPVPNINKMLAGDLAEPKLYNSAAVCKLLNFSLDEHFGIAASADSRITTMLKEREAIQAEREELRQEAQKVPVLQNHLESLKAEVESKENLLRERADYLRLKDKYNKWLGMGLVVSVTINLALLFIL